MITRQLNRSWPSCDNCLGKLDGWHQLAAALPVSSSKRPAESFWVDSRPAIARPRRDADLSVISNSRYKLELHLVRIGRRDRNLPCFDSCVLQSIGEPRRYRLNDLSWWVIWRAATDDQQVVDIA